MTHRPVRPSIARIWRGRTARERADEYEEYNYQVGIKPLLEKASGARPSEKTATPRRSSSRFHIGRVSKPCRALPEAIRLGFITLIETPNSSSNYLTECKS